MIKAIIFDCFGVLTADTWHEFRLSLPPDQQDEASDLNHQYGAGMISEPEFLNSVSELTGKSEDEISHLIDNEQSKNRALLDYIRTLKPKYKIGLLSNVASSWIQDEFLTAEEQTLFDAYVLSFEEGITKPDPRIYRIAAERLGVLPAECIYIDDIDRYAAAAENEGMKALVYKDFSRFKQEISALLYPN